MQRSTFLHNKQLPIAAVTVALVVVLSCAQVCGDVADGLAIQIGEFAGEAAEATAVAKLSEGQNQQSWWRLASARWHDSALDRFFATGPPNAEHIAEASGMTDNYQPDWAGRAPSAVLQNLASITHTKSRRVQGMGRIEASVQTILFRCRQDDDTCASGYLEPLIVTGATTAATQSTSPGGQGFFADSNVELTYAGLWLRTFPAMLYNAIPATLNGSPRSSLRLPTDDPEASVTVHVNSAMPPCNATAYVFYRLHLDAAYGLLPGLSCINLSRADGQMNAMVLAAAPAVVSARNELYTPAYTIEELLRVVLDQSRDSVSAEYLPLGQCSQEPLLFTYSGFISQGKVRVCGRTVCAYATIGDSQHFSCNISQQQQPLLPLYRLSFLQSISSLSKSCNVSEQLLSAIPGNVLANSTVSCGGLHPTEPHKGNQVTCTMVGVNVTYVPSSEGTFGYVEAPESEWATSKGVNTSDFKNAFYNISFSQACSISIQPWLFPGSTDSSFLNVIHIRAKSLLERFVQAHAITFNMENGPPMDLFNSLSVLLSTIVSVLLGCEGSVLIMHALLKTMFQKWPARLQLGRPTTAFRHLDFLVAFCLAGFNTILTAAIFFPVTYGAFIEFNRQKPFHTWDIASSDVGFDTALHLRIIYFLEGESKYVSHSAPPNLVAAILVVCFVAYRTFTSLKRHISMLSSTNHSSTQCTTSAIIPTYATSAQTSGSTMRNSSMHMATSPLMDRNSALIGNGPDESLANTTSRRQSVDDIELSANINLRPQFFSERGLPATAESRAQAYTRHLASLDPSLLAEISDPIVSPPADATRALVKLHTRRSSS